MKQSSDNEKQSVQERILLWLVPVVGALFALSGVAVLASAADVSVFDHQHQGYQPLQARSRWGVSYENDFFVPGGNDRDYTFGLAISHSSASPKTENWHGALSSFDTLLGLQSRPNRRGFEGGFYGFTPADKTFSTVNTEDRPFSSLVYLATSHERINPMQQSVVRTQLSIGVLGLSIVGQVQEQLHDLIGNEQPQGWDKQVSNGGEPSARYVISKQRLIGKASNRIEVRETRTASAGYLTEASWGLSMRAGKLNSSWYEFNPDVASYAESSSSVNRGSNERFFWAGMAVKLRAYNAFLQGQFRDSAHRLNASELNHTVVEAWAGYTQSFSSGYFLSYGLRGHSSEIKNGEGNRDVVWGGLMLGKENNLRNL